MANEVERLVREFTAKLEQVIRAQVVAEIDSAVRAAVQGIGGQVRGGGRGRASAKAPSAKIGGVKRTPEQIAKTAAKLLAFIAANPGQRAEQIAEGTKIGTGEMALPIKRLLAEKKIKASGVARGTTYVVVK
jgi:hypothetical protein